MNAQEYIKTELEELAKPQGLKEIKDKEELKAEIFRYLMSKKFRKYSVNPEYLEHIRGAIKLSIDKNEPIKLTLVFGGYKLWRFAESPEVDWAELFSLMYYTEWLKPICEIYKPGVWFDFFSDDEILEIMDNIPKEDTRKYADGFKRLIDFLKHYVPVNLSFTYNRVGDQYESYEAFKNELTESIKNVERTLSGLPKLTDEQEGLVDLNVRLNPGQADDPEWKEKVFLIHEGYAKLSKRRPYYRTPEKIFIITRPIPDSIAVGTTKRSIAKFWCGIGVLTKQEGSFHTLVLSPSQVEKSEFSQENVELPGLTGKNFHSVKILNG